MLGSSLGWWESDLEGANGSFREFVADGAAAGAPPAVAAFRAAEVRAVRRAFHTLKGSSRMVGFKSVGEGAWAALVAAGLLSVLLFPLSALRLLRGAERNPSDGVPA